jgi:hypothetical protein
MPAVTVGGNGPAEMRKLAVALREADPRLRRQLYRRMRATAAPVQHAVMRAALDMPAGKYHHGLREEIAKTIFVSVGATKSGVRMDVVSAGSRMPQGKETLPVHTDRRRGWGHPVFLHGTVARLPRADWTWVRQWGTPGWFEDSIAKAAGRERDAIQAAMDDVKRELEH